VKVSRRSYWSVRVPKPRLSDSAEASRFLLGGWLMTSWAALACLSGAHGPALALGSVALFLVVLAVFA
jgi:hypothetical protein